MSIFRKEDKEALKPTFMASAILLVLLSVIILISAYGSFRYLADKLIGQAEENLQVLAQMKADRIRDLIANWQGDSNIFASRDSVQRTLGGIDPAKEALDLSQAMAETQNIYGYRRIFVVDNDFQVVSPITAHPLDPAELSALREAVKTRSFVVVDLHPTSDGEVVYGAALPVFSHGDRQDEIVGSVYLEQDARKDLFPLLAVQPMSSPSAESLLVRRDGDNILYLSPLRYRPEVPPLTLRLPIHLTALTITQKALVTGHAGLMEGINYRGVDVVGAIHPVPHTSWIMVTKIDRDEIEEPARMLGMVILGVAFTLMTLLITLFWLFWYRRSLQMLKRANEQLQTSELRYRRLFEAAKDGILILDAETGRVEDANPFLIELLDYPREEVIGKHLWELGGLRHVAANRENFRLLQLHEYLRYEDLPLETSTGKNLSVEFISNVYQVDHARVIQCNIRDITARKLAEDKLRLAASVFASSQEGIVITDADNRIIDVNPSFTRITGYAPEEVLGRNPSLLRSGRQDAAFYIRMWQSIQSNRAWQGEVWNRRKSGEIYPEMLSISAVIDDTGLLRHYVGVLSDISLIKAREADLERIAYFDPLTGVPNRRLLLDRLSQSLAHVQRTGGLLAVCYLDLDGFKPVNDQFGHNAGDRLLVEITCRLQGILRAGDTLARLGGDEFAILLGNIEQDRECFDILERALTAIEIPVILQDQSVSVSASLGVTLYPRDNADPGMLLRHADQAMYQAKEAGKNRFFLYDSEQNQEIRATREKRQRLASALECQELVLHYTSFIHKIRFFCIILVFLRHPLNP
ncbi:hypothetical protein CCP4SC76_7840006 [Gammaproteobacteria bacterium]